MKTRSPAPPNILWHSIATILATLTLLLEMPIGLHAAGFPQLPNPQNPVPVSNSTALANALSNAAPGDEISLASGTYSQSGGFTITANGTAAHPIVIKSSTLLGGEINSAFTVSGDYVILYGLTFDGATVAINGGADEGKIVRCHFDDSGSGTNLVLVDAKNWEIAYNEWVDFDRIGLRLRYDNATYSAEGAHVHHNYFHYTPSFTAGSGNGHEAMGIGEGVNDRPCYMNALIEFNLIENVNPPAPENETLSVKSCGNIIRFNTLDGCRLANNRYGYDNQWIANWIEDGLGLNTRDGKSGHGNLFVGNYVKNCSQDFGVSCGVTSPDDYPGALPTGANAKVAAFYTTLIGNITEGCDLVLGQNSQNSNHVVPADETTIEAHVYGTGSSRVNREFTGTSIDAQTNTSESGTTSYEPVPETFKLDTSDVGPNATSFNAPDITTALLPGGVVGVAYNESLSSTGGDGQLVWSLDSGILPAGLTLNNIYQQTATISGTPTSAGTANFTIKLTDTLNDHDTQALGIAVVSTQVEAPSSDPGAGTYVGTQSVAITTATGGASIRYTTDGSAPTSTTGTLYGGAFNLNNSATLKAIAYKSGMSDSAVTSGAFTILDPTQCPFGYTIALYNVGRSKYVRADAGDGYKLKADSATVTAATHFTVVDNGDGSFSLHHVPNSGYAYPGPTDQILIATGATIGIEDKYSWSVNGDGTISIFSIKFTGKSVFPLAANNDILQATGASIGPEDKYTWVLIP